MTPTSAAQAEAAARGELPPVEEVRPGLWALPSPMPGGGYLSFAYIWALRGGDGAIDLVDGGMDTPENRELLVQQLAALGARTGDVRRVVITHLHPNHTGVAQWLHESNGTEVLMGAVEELARKEFGTGFTIDRIGTLEQWGVPHDERAPFATLGTTGGLPPLDVDTMLESEQMIVLGDTEMRVLRTPGHTVGHIVLADHKNRQLYTGDHILPTLHPGIGLGGPSASNPLTDFLASCAAMESYDDFEALPGHGYRFRGVAERAVASAAHHLRRADEVREILLASPGASVWQLAQRLSWKVGWARLHVGFRYSALMQTAIFRDYVRESADIPARP